MVALEIQNIPYLPLHDLYGNLAALINPANHIAQYYDYTAFGEELFTSALSPWRFSSKRTDPETTLVYFGRRYYIPSEGRWLTPDPLGFEAGPNYYAFVSNAPLTHYDDYGLLGYYRMNESLKELFHDQRFNSNDFKQFGIGAIH